MTSHLWGEEEFDWAALDSACCYLEKNCRRWARLGVWTKEKYGTMRVSTTCAYFSEYDFIHHIFYPGHVSYHWPIWFRKYIDWPLGKVIRALRLLRLINRYQTAVLKFFWKRAASKWPHISKEILDEYNWMIDND